MGLLTGGGVGAGLLTAEKGLAKELRSTSALGSLPPLTAVRPALTVPAHAAPRAESQPGAHERPQHGPNPANGNLAFEGRTETISRAIASA
jgi:hypothetical protein